MSIKLIDSFTEFKNMKNIDRPTMVRVIEDVFRTLIRKKYGADDNFDVIVGAVDGDLEIWRRREIVPEGEVEDERYQIDITIAMDLDPDSAEIGGEYFEKLDILEDFGRRAIMAARQTLISRILELEKDKTYKIYVDKVGVLVTGEISQVLKREFVVVDDNTGAELILPKSDIVKGDYFRKGDMVRAIIKKVELRNNSPVILLSRTDESFLAKLLEMEVPEIEDGLIIIRRIVRAPGERAKIAVESYDLRIDPVGACVGTRGSRISGIVRELRNENIDVINYTDNDKLFIQRALTPAKVVTTSIETDPDKRRASVHLTAEEVSKAIGKKGINIKLASRLTNYTIDVFREGFEDNEYDVELDEFRDELEGWVIDALKSIGCDTARSVLEISPEELATRADLEEETVMEILRVLHSEFEN